MDIVHSKYALTCIIMKDQGFNWCRNEKQILDLCKMFCKSCYAAQYFVMRCFTLYKNRTNLFTKNLV